jgi:hypothetical protein
MLYDIYLHEYKILVKNHKNLAPVPVFKPLIVIQVGSKVL